MRTPQREIYTNNQYIQTQGCFFAFAARGPGRNAQITTPTNATAASFHAGIATGDGSMVAVYAGYSMKAIGDYSGLHYSRVNRIVAGDRKAKW